MIIIPARLKSTRLPNKVLAKIGDMPMVIKTAKAVENIDRVIIATDSEEVAKVAKEYGFESVITCECNSGTDRVYEAAKKLNLNDDEIILNIQADEPFIEKEVVQALFDLTKKEAKNEDVIMCSCYKIIDKNSAKDSNIVKVVTNLNSYALYFSRSLIPFSRDDNLNEYKAHLGLYGFTMKKLRKFCQMKSGTLEDIEKLEQLRVLDNGYKIAMAEVKSKSFGIDTKEDLEKANDKLRAF